VEHLSVNLYALLSAALGVIVLGGLWYSPLLFGRPWQRALQAASVEGQASLMVAPAQLFLVPVNALAMAVALWLLFAWMDVQTVILGIVVAALMWAGFGLPAFIWQQLYGNRPIQILLIDSGYQLLSAVVTGAILSAWRAGYLPFLNPPPVS